MSVQQVGPVGEGVPPVETGPASLPREGDSLRSLGAGDSPSRPLGLVLECLFVFLIDRGCR